MQHPKYILTSDYLGLVDSANTEREAFRLAKEYSKDGSSIYVSRAYGGDSGDVDIAEFTNGEKVN